MLIIGMIDSLQSLLMTPSTSLIQKSISLDVKNYQLSQNCHNLQVAIISYLYLSKGIGTEVILFNLYKVPSGLIT